MTGFPAASVAGYEWRLPSSSVKSSKSCVGKEWLRTFTDTSGSCA